MFLFEFRIVYILRVIIDLVSPYLSICFMLVTVTKGY